LNLRLKRPSIPRGFLQDSCYREGEGWERARSAGAGDGEMSRRKKPRTLVSVEDGQAAGGEPRGRSTSVSEHASCPAHASGVFGCVRRPHKLSHGRLAPREAARGSVRGLVPHATPLLATVFCRNLDAP
jgi:hypothetical protein